METTDRNWLEEAEEVLRDLRDVQGASILAEDRNIKEIHILASPGRSAKHIVRDIETCLRTRFSIGIDHRVVSVAFSKTPAARAATAAARAEDAPGPGHAGYPPRAQAAAPSVSSDPPKAPPAAEERPRSVHPVQPVPAPAVTERPAQPGPAPEPRGPKVAADPRIRFASVNVYVSGPRVQAQVELRWKGLSRMGSASGWASRDSAHRLIAAATLSAVQEFLEETWAMSLQDIELVRMGRAEVVMVGMSLITHRHEKLLAGCCPVEQDAQQAVVLATLSAVNRVVGGLPTREPTEYVLRPASRQEGSGAKKH